MVRPAEKLKFPTEKIRIIFNSFFPLNLILLLNVYKLPQYENKIFVSDCILISYIFIMLLLSIIVLPNGFPGGTCGEEPTCQCRLDLRDMGSISESGKIPWRRAWQPSLVFWPGESHGQRSLVGCSPWGRMELDTT